MNRNGMVISIIAIVATASCSVGNDECVNDVRAKVPNLTGGLDIVVFSRECGATVGPNIQISLIEKNRLPESGGNITIFDHDDDFFPARDIKWRDKNVVVIKTQKSARFFSKQKHYRGVKILYEVADPE